MTSVLGSAVRVFLACQEAIAGRRLVTRTSAADKEFHFQHWFAARLEEANVLFDPSGRNAYPDFVAAQTAEGFEVKGLAWPGREATYDANSQVPTGYHNGRTIFYVFGRYPAGVVEHEYPVVDLVMCHGDFLNAHHEYVHKNRSFTGFGSYGDIMIRDRKMYVAPTPFALTSGTTGQRTLILPTDSPADDRLEAVGLLVRVESPRLVVGYEFGLVSNTLTPRYTDNPTAGTTHEFVAYRVRGEEGPPVLLAGAGEQTIAGHGDE